MKETLKKKLAILTTIVFPILIGFVINKLLTLGFTNDNNLLIGLSSNLLVFWSFVGPFYWLMAGYVLTKVFGIERKRVMLTIGPILIAFLAIYTVAFLILDPSYRMNMIVGLSQTYVLGLIGFTTKIVKLFTHTINITYVVIGSYLLNFIILVIGCTGFRKSGFNDFK